MPIHNIEVTYRGPYSSGVAFGETGPYERLDGVLEFSVDPGNVANRLITDLELAPQDESGRVRFKSDFTLLVPATQGRSNKRLIVDVVNRGRRRVVGTFNRGPLPSTDQWDVHPGDGFLFKHGYSVVSVGWQWDVFKSESLLGLEPPYAMQEGKQIQGQVVVEMRPNEVEHTRLLADRVHKPYPVFDLDEESAILIVRDWEDGPDTVVSRNQWQFAKETENGTVRSHEHVYLESGFQPGKIYYMIYTTEGAPVVGTGLLAVREIATFFRNVSQLNPVNEGFEKVFGYGVSQTGRLLRHFLYLGLNLDEEGRVVYDGLIPHVAGGRRGEFNHRFAQPSAQSNPSFGHNFPFVDNERHDPVSGRRDGLLTRIRQIGGVPRVFYTNSSNEYWRGDGSLVHIDPADATDVEPAPETRIYHFAGTQHGAGSLPQGTLSPFDGSRALYPFNIVDYRPLLRAVLLNLDSWVTDGIEPPPSAHPRIADGTAMTQRDLLLHFRSVPGLQKPDPERLWKLRQVDLGPDADRGIGHYPVREGGVYRCFVPAIDPDGNEVTGIRLPDLRVPVGTHAGWNLRDPETGSPEQLMSMQGFSNFFPVDGNVRSRSGDQRRSIRERYTSREKYEALVCQETENLIADRYVLAEDCEFVVQACLERFDLAVQGT
jgi:hypothetical protein